MVMIQYYTYIYKDSLKDMMPFYVGKGSNDRAYDHLKGNKYNPHFYYTIQKMLREGNKPEIEIINVTCEQTALRLEMFLIVKYGRVKLGTGTLLNLTDGGDGQSGYKHTEEDKKKRSERMSGEGNPMFGRFGVDNPMFGKERLDLAERNRNNSPNLGKKRPEHSKRMMGRSSPIMNQIDTCPHCGKSGNVPNMKRWHFENCKLRI